MPVKEKWSAGQTEIEMNNKLSIYEIFILVNWNLCFQEFGPVTTLNYFLMQNFHNDQSNDEVIKVFPSQSNGTRFESGFDWYKMVA